jgi:UDP-N-acetylmuramoyl-tripeptide--D-alanyl-D-alanine ligase
MRHLPGLTVIGVTGSNGKTTTKEIIFSILSKHAATAANPGNLNSEIGLPMAVLDIPPGSKFAVLEMGMNRKGEMDLLAEIARPSYGVITNIGTAHIGLLGSREAIAAEKARVFKYVGTDGRGFIHENEDFAEFLTDRCSGGVDVFGPGSTEGFEGADSAGLRGSVIHWNGRGIHFPLIGEHNIANALCAITVARRLGVKDDIIAAGLEDLRPLFGRGEVLKGPVTVIQDCYNANGESMVKAIDFVSSIPWTGRKILILGSMKELGADSDREHHNIGRYAADSNADAVIFFGEESAAAYAAATERSEENRFWWTADFNKLEERVKDQVKEGDLVLLKGSRSVALERLGSVLAGTEAADS